MIYPNIKVKFAWVKYLITVNSAIFGNVISGKEANKFSTKLNKVQSKIFNRKFTFVFPSHLLSVLIPTIFGFEYLI